MTTGAFPAVALCRSVVFAGCVVTLPAVVGLADIESTGAAQLIDRGAPTRVIDAEGAEAPQVTAPESRIVSAVDAAAAATPAPIPPSTNGTATVPEGTESSDKPEAAVETASTSSSEMLPTDTLPAQVTTAARPDREPDDITGSVSPVDIVDECFVMEICVDRYLWDLYQRTPKQDTIKEYERRKVTVRKKHRTLTVTRTFTKLVDEDFAWKDPKAAEKVGLSMMTYVIGGMDRDFRLKLYYTLRAAEAAGLSPGITSAFRDDYRQSIASGLKAATNRSYHGGSLRGGYGHGLAADVVSLKGAPPHVAPIDGQEYATHNGGETTRQAASDVKKRKRLAMRNEHAAAKRAASAKSKTGTIRSARDTPSRASQAKLHS